MNPNRYAKNQTAHSLGIGKLGCILTLTMLLDFGEDCHAQLAQLPSNFDQRPRVDTAGNIVDAHDGMMAQFGNVFYLYGTAYGGTDGWRYQSTEYNNRYRCYTSTDLVNWTPAADNLLKLSVNCVLTNPPSGLYFRPHVIYNQANNQYVLWYNWWAQPSHFDESYLGVAVSSSPTGPFVIYNDKAQTGIWDFNLFVDNDQNRTAYMIYTYGGTQIQTLDANYYNLTGSTVYPGGKQASGEAPLLFKNLSTSTYYAMWGNQCAFCPQGSSCLVATCPNAASPFGAWNSTVSDINPANSSGIHNIPAQPTYVATISTTSGTDYIWMGDLWGTGPNWTIQPPLFSGGGDRGQDQQYWTQLNFDSSGRIGNLGPYSRNLTLMNQSSQSWGDYAQVVAVPNGNGGTINLGTVVPWWYSGTLAQWSTGQSSVPLDPLTIGTSYTLELQDIYYGTITTIPQVFSINGAAYPFGPSYAGGSISGYVYHESSGGYWGWFTGWNGQLSPSTATLTLVNAANQYSGDSLRIVAYLNNSGNPIVVGSRSGNWNPQQTWTVSLSALWAGYPYSFELQDTDFSDAVIPPRSSVLEVPSSGSMGSGGCIYNTGSGGYWGWYVSWGW